MNKKTEKEADSDGIVRTQIRLPEDVYWALRRAASRYGRPMNSELVVRLRAALALDEELHPPPENEREALSQSLERLFYKVQDFSDLLGEMKDRVDGRGDGNQSTDKADE